MRLKRKIIGDEETVRLENTSSPPSCSFIPPPERRVLFFASLGARFNRRIKFCCLLILWVLSTKAWANARQLQLSLGLLQKLIVIEYQLLRIEALYSSNFYFQSTFCYWVFQFDGLPANS
ncbi:hypothetical protein L6164_006073 [Bauhinia variegata]|uniref:Uncharacterized protein n=1 Tax=Bauhinia variegata TaxID=167791 RepID=A0ACB9PVZ1_BAUVA|nr:hypothetical protein L6164_006073 [Bauhinia variegata]